MILFRSLAQILVVLTLASVMVPDKPAEAIIIAVAKAVRTNRQ
jgi:hypothetical protein